MIISQIKNSNFLVVNLCHNPFLGYSPIHIFYLFKKKYNKIKKNILSKNNSSEKRMLEPLKMVKIWLRRFKITKIKI